ncbi:MAG TPA: glutamate--tRNA ligase [Actinomycetota bacterium]|nr:glutamate--tRNA ligase [Actinomycetota bacterium]
MRVRFAPNPSGDLHIGTAHTAFFNWLYARHEGGVFVLRIEDTDPETAKPELVDPIMESLRWLGINWDEGPDIGGSFGPYRDSERRTNHEETVEQLLSAGAAYRCWCTREQLEARGVKAGYDRHCRMLSDADRATRSAEPAAIRFAVPDGRDVVVDDLVMGEVKFEYADLQDRVIVRSDGSPLYLLAVTSDDVAMEITHVLRGADLLPSTPLQILITEALGADLPTFAHLPLLLGENKGKLSKRKGSDGVLSFRERGFLPEALVNFLALLGWSSPTQEEKLSVEQIIREFTIDRVIEHPAVFDTTKLSWLNQQYIIELDDADLVRRVVELDPSVPVDVVQPMAELIKTRVTTLAEVPDAIRYIHERPKLETSKWLGTDEANNTLEAVAEELGSLEPWTAQAIGEAIQKVIADLGLNRRKGTKPIFVAISGSEVSLPLYESIELIGRSEAVARLRAASSG